MVPMISKIIILLLLINTSFQLEEARTNYEISKFEGESVQLACGENVENFAWEFTNSSRGIKLFEHSTGFLNNFGEIFDLKDSHLIIKNLKMADQGRYRCLEVEEVLLISEIHLSIRAACVGATIPADCPTEEPKSFECPTFPEPKPCTTQAVESTTTLSTVHLTTQGVILSTAPGKRRKLDVECGDECYKGGHKWFLCEKRKMTLKCKKEEAICNHTTDTQTVATGSTWDKLYIHISIHAFSAIAIVGLVLYICVLKKQIKTNQSPYQIPMKACGADMDRYISNTYDFIADPHNQEVGDLDYDKYLKIQDERDYEIPVTHSPDYLPVIS